MNVCYYTLKIKDELDGAKAYIEDAISKKKSHPDWAKLYAEMSDAELTHAKNLIAIFEDDYKKDTEKLSDIPSIYTQIHDDILKMYTEGASCVKQMQSVYTSK